MPRREINRRAAENFISSAPFPIFGDRAAIRHEGSRRAGVRGHHTIIALLSVSGVLSWIRHHSDLRGGKPVQRIRKEFTKAFRALAGW